MWQAQSIWFVWLDETHQMDRIDQMNETDRQYSSSLC
jgi:hypothetical protein